MNSSRHARHREIDAAACFLGCKNISAYSSKGFRRLPTPSVDFYALIVGNALTH